MHVVSQFTSMHSTYVAIYLPCVKCLLFMQIRFFSECDFIPCFHGNCCLEFSGFRLSLDAICYEVSYFYFLVFLFCYISLLF